MSLCRQHLLRNIVQKGWNLFKILYGASKYILVCAFNKASAATSKIDLECESSTCAHIFCLILQTVSCYSHPIVTSPQSCSVWSLDLIILVKTLTCLHKVWMSVWWSLVFFLKTSLNHGAPSWNACTHAKRTEAQARSVLSALCWAHFWSQCVDWIKLIVSWSFKCPLAKERLKQIDAFQLLDSCKVLASMANYMQNENPRNPHLLYKMYFIFS